MKYNVGDRVKVSNVINHSTHSKHKFVGANGMINGIEQDACTFPYEITFDDHGLRQLNKLEGVWLWSNAELELIPSK